MDGIATQPGMATTASGGTPAWSLPSEVQQWHYSSSTEVGGEWTDRSGNGNHGTVNSAPTFDANGAEFGNISESVDIQVSFTDSGPFSLLAWLFVPSGYSASDLPIFGNRNATNSRFWVDVTGGNWRMGMFTPIAYTSPTRNIVNSWNHYAWVQDGSNVKMYINGVQEGTSSGLMADLSGLDKIGNADNLKTLGSGTRIDDVMICPSDALTPSQITGIYDNSPGTHKP